MIHKGGEESVGKLLVQTASIGGVDTATVVVQFNRAVDTTGLLTDGVTINVNSLPVSVSSATRQSDKSIVHYVISAVDANDVVEFVYSSGSTVDYIDNAILLEDEAVSVFNAVGTYLLFSVADNSSHLITLEI